MIAVFAQATSLATCGVLSNANTYYSLTQNITNNAGCLRITANNITVDLNGYSIIYDNSSSASGIQGVYINGNGFTLKNGGLIQGAGAGQLCINLYAEYISNLNVTNVTSINYGTNCNNLVTLESKNLSFTYNNLVQNVTNVTDRSNKAISQIGTGVQRGGYLYVQHNNLTGYGQMGITAGRSSSSNYGNYSAYGTVTDFDISYNYINMTAVVTNGFAMAISGYEANAFYIPKIHDNIIRQVNARGIDIDAIDDLLGMKGGWIYNNYVETQESCKTDNLGGDMTRDAVCRTMSLSIRGCDTLNRTGAHSLEPCNPTGENSNLWVFNNTFIAREGVAVPNLPYIDLGIWKNDNVTRGSVAFRLINIDYAGANGTYENNTFAAYRNTANNDFAGILGNGGTYYAAGLYLNGILPGNHYIFRGNKYIGSEYPIWIDGQGIQFINDQIVNTSINANRFRAILYGFYASNVINNIFYNLSFVNIPGGFDSVYYSMGSPGGLMNYTAKWFAKTTVEDENSNLLSGATVNFYNLQNVLEATGTTDATGTFLANLTQFTEECDFANCRALGKYYRNTTTPHTMTVTYNGETQSRTIALTQSKNELFVFTLGAGSAPVISNIAIASLTNVSATISWQTDSYSNSSIIFGPASGSYPYLSGQNDNVRAHSVILNNLQNGTIYYYKVSSCNLFGCSQSLENSFNTLAFGATPTPTATTPPETGCAYSNPPCGSGFNCIGNNCVPISTGCSNCAGPGGPGNPPKSTTTPTPIPHFAIGSATPTIEASLELIKLKKEIDNEIYQLPENDALDIRDLYNQAELLQKEGKNEQALILLKRAREKLQRTIIDSKAKKADFTWQIAILALISILAIAIYYIKKTHHKLKHLEAVPLDTTGDVNKPGPPKIG